MRMFCGLVLLLVCVSLAPVPVASAHHSPSDVIEALTRRIENGERLASTLVRRGDEYRAIGDNRSAVADYESALQLMTGDYPALYGLAQAYFSLSQWEEAEDTAKRGVTSASNKNEAAPFHAILARIYELNEQWEMALHSWQQTLASSRPKVDWFLGESRSLKRLNRIDEARVSLESAMKRNPSTVLRRAWIDMLIDCHEIQEAGNYISNGLTNARWKSSWLLLRARLHLAQNHSEAAQQDARIALSEIDRRLSPASVNPFLTADREIALLILGRADGARPDIELSQPFSISHKKPAE